MGDYEPDYGEPLEEEEGRIASKEYTDAYIKDLQDNEKVSLLRGQPYTPHVVLPLSV